MKDVSYSDEQSGVCLGGPHFKSVPQQILHVSAVILGIFKTDARMQLVASLFLSLCMEQCDSLFVSLCMEQCDSHQMIHMKFCIWYF
jgi:hypothetical protein